MSPARQGSARRTRRLAALAALALVALLASLGSGAGSGASAQTAASGRLVERAPSYALIQGSGPRGPPTR